MLCRFFITKTCKYLVFIVRVILYIHHKVLDIATLTGACSVALGTAATGVFCTDTKDFAALER